jgi:hypothetical protein
MSKTSILEDLLVSALQVSMADQRPRPKLLMLQEQWNSRVRRNSDDDSCIFWRANWSFAHLLVFVLLNEPLRQVGCHFFNSTASLDAEDRRCGRFNQ